MNNTNNGPQQYTAPQTQNIVKKQSGLGIAGFVVSLVGFLVSIATGLFGRYIGLIFDIPALGLSLFGMLQGKKKRGLAIAGTAISVVAILLCAIVSSSPSEPDDIAQQINTDTPAPAEITQPSMTNDPSPIESTPTEDQELHPTESNREEILPGEIIETGKYINADDVTIYFDGEKFNITNKGEDIVRVFAHVVGVKVDGTTEYLQDASLYGIDKTKYETDLEENGWAVEHPTNIVRPGETLQAEMTIYDFLEPDPDIDDDGYYDIIFIVSPQLNEETITISINDYTSKPYKIKK